MSAFSVDTGQQTTPPLIDGVVHNRLVQFIPHGDQTLAQLVDESWNQMYTATFL